MIGVLKGKREEAFAWIVWFWLICGVLLGLLAFTVPADSREIQRRVQAAMTAMWRSGRGQVIQETEGYSASEKDNDVDQENGNDEANIVQEMEQGGCVRSTSTALAAFPSPSPLSYISCSEPLKVKTTFKTGYEKCEISSP